MRLGSSFAKRKNDVDDDDERGDTKAMPVGLVENPAGMGFRCGTCEWFDSGYCRNGNKAIKDMKVDAFWCCNLYDNDGMKIIVR
jgi:hypothetical protein